MTVKSLLELQNTNNSEQNRTLLAKVIQFLSLLKNVKIKDTSFLLPTDNIILLTWPYEMISLARKILLNF